MRRPVIVASLLIALPALAPASGLAQSFRKPLDRVLDAEPLNRHLWGIAVADTSGKVLYARNGDRLFIPASNTKLVVTAVAAALLPPDFTVRTSVYGTGPVVDGVLSGHLVLYGRGDPTMGERCYDVDSTRASACTTDGVAPLRELARALHARGIHTVTGDVVGDGSYFEPTIVHPTWEFGDLPWWYATPVSGLGLLDNSLRLTATPTAPGRPADLTLFPRLGGTSLENRTRSVAEDQPRTLEVQRDQEGRRFVVSGDIPITARVRPDYVAVADPALFTAEAFRSVLGEEGIAVLGGTRATTDSLDFQPARAGAPLAEVASRPLRDWLFPILNTSQNWYAEMLLKQLGRQFGQAGSWREGLAVERRFLVDSVGVDSTQFALSDGSGLSTINLVSPQAFVKLLTFMRRHPRYQVWAAGLPRAGEPGSLRNRFAGTPVEGRVAAKTGSISRVNTLSGYLRRPDGKTLVFSIQANHHIVGGRAMIAAIDSAVVALAK